jgi:hypothetical protein
MDNGYKRLTDFLSGLGLAKVAHTEKSFLAHLVGVYLLMRSRGCTEEVCRAGMFHSIYGTQSFQGFALPLERRPEVRSLIGERAERIAYLNCALDRPSFDRTLERGEEPYTILDRLTDKEVAIAPDDFEDLCRVHFYDWLEQVPRSRLWEYRRATFRRLAERLGAAAREEYDRAFAAEGAEAGA